MKTHPTGANMPKVTRNEMLSATKRTVKTPPTDATGAGMTFNEQWVDNINYLSNTDTQCVQYVESRWHYVGVEFEIENTGSCSFLYKNSYVSADKSKSYALVADSLLTNFGGTDWSAQEFDTIFDFGNMATGSTPVSHPGFKAFEFFSDMVGTNVDCVGVPDPNELYYIIEESIGLVRGNGLASRISPSFKWTSADSSHAFEIKGCRAGHSCATDGIVDQF